MSLTNEQLNAIEEMNATGTVVVKGDVLRQLISMAREAEHLRSERDRLAGAIVEAATASGLIDGTQGLTGPQLLMTAYDMGSELSRLRAEAGQVGNQRRAVENEQV